MTILGRGDLAPRRRHRRRAPRLLALVVVLAALAGGGWLIWRHVHHTGRDAAVTVSTPCPTPSGRPAPPPPAAVRVDVRNTTPRDGLAHTVASALHARGFTVTSVTNATAAVRGVAVIRYAAGARAAATTLAEYVPGATVVAGGTAGHVELDLGPGFRTLAPASVVATARARDLAAASPSAVPCPRGSATAG